MMTELEKQKQKKQKYWTAVLRRIVGVIIFLPERFVRVTYLACQIVLLITAKRHDQSSISKRARQNQTLARDSNKAHSSVLIHTGKWVHAP